MPPSICLTGKRLNSEYASEHQISAPAARTLARWRALSSEEKRTARHGVVIDRVAASMAMEDEEVSAEWIQQAQKARV